MCLSSHFEERIPFQKCFLQGYLGSGFLFGLVLTSVISDLINPLITLTFQFTKKTAQIEPCLNTKTSSLHSRLSDDSSGFFFLKLGFRELLELVTCMCCPVCCCASTL